MPSSRSHQPKALLFGLALAFASCASDPLPPRDAAVEHALASFGSVREEGAGGHPLVVLIEDRHSSSGRLQAERGPIVEVRRQSYQAVRWLVEAGFGHLGCEYEAGPLPEDGPARQQRELIASLRATASDIDAWNLFQPLRYEESFGRRLEVQGVEDQALYQADVRALDRLRAIDTPSPEDLRTDAERSAERMELFAVIAARVALRGTRAGENLHRWLAAEGAPHGILVLGAAHADAATAELVRRGARVLRLRTFALEARALETRP